MYGAIVVYNGKDPEEGIQFEFKEPVMAAIRATGLFTLPLCTTDDGHKAIDLKIFRIRVEDQILTCKPKLVEQAAVIRALSEFRYLIWVDSREEN